MNYSLDPFRFANSCCYQFNSIVKVLLSKLHQHCTFNKFRTTSFNQAGWYKEKVQLIYKMTPYGMLLDLVYRIVDERFYTFNFN